MKTQKPLFFFLVVLLFAACGKEEPPVNTPRIPKPDTLAAGWKFIALDTGDIRPVLFDIYFNNPTTGYAVGDYLWKTQDGGAHWTKMSFTQGYNLAVTPNGNVFLVPLDIVNGLYKSTDGGGSFSQSRPISTGQYSDIWFTGDDTGYVSTSNGLLRTVDAGNTWLPVNTTGLDTASYYSSLFFFNDNTGWVCDSSYVYKTNGSINSWSKSVIHKNSAFRYVNSIFATSPNNIYLSVSNGEIYKSTDGGSNFYLRSLAFETLNPQYSDLHFVDDNTGYIAYGRRIYKTTDGGAHWQMVVALGESYIAEIHFTDANHGWACGDEFILTYNP